MIYIVCALYIEAKPIIELYKLKKNNESRYFQLFENQDIKLVISGTGIINSSAAVSYILSPYNISKEDIIINFGICGSRVHDKGEVFLINKINDNGTGRNFYPDILFNHPFHEESLTTYSRPVYNKDIPNLCDMEGSGFFKTASIYLPPHGIQLIKVVSDSLTGERMDINSLNEILKNNIDKLDGYLKCMLSGLKEKSIISEDDFKIIEAVSLNLKLTYNQRCMLKKYYVGYKIRYGVLPECVREFLKVRVNLKNESKKQFSRITELLSK